MNRGTWHQCGDKSQRVVQEQLELGVGSGVIVSPRDLKLDGASRYAALYQESGAEVVLDPQFYIPEFTNANLVTYPFSGHRTAISQLNQISDSALDTLAQNLEAANRELGTAALIAPAVIYEAARGDIVLLNARLFSAAKRAANVLGIPAYATIVLGRSVTGSMQTLIPVLSQATAMSADGWYFVFEVEPERIVSAQAAVERIGKASLTLACTGAPVLHAYAGPLALLSMDFGATAAAIGHSQNIWRFSPERWLPTSGRGGGGDAPPRFFSSALWGTVVYPDETAQLAPATLAEVLTHSPFSHEVAQQPPQSWPRWAANKHLLYIIGSTVARLSHEPTARDAAGQAEAILNRALALHAEIASTGLQLTDETNRYQANWVLAMATLLTNSSQEYDYLEMIS